LRAAHNTPCDAAQAYFLIAFLHEKHFAGYPAPIVRLRKPIKGRHRARGWGGAKTVKRGDSTVRRGYVSLPITPYPGVGLPHGYLRVGLVIHEFTHAFEMLKFGSTSHDVRFTLFLDTLLQETESFWRI
jgi:hypothetical protein